MEEKKTEKKIRKIISTYHIKLTCFCLLTSLIVQCVVCVRACNKKENWLDPVSHLASLFLHGHDFFLSPTYSLLCPACVCMSVLRRRRRRRKYVLFFLGIFYVALIEESSSPSPAFQLSSQLMTHSTATATRRRELHVSGAPFFLLVFWSSLIYWCACFFSLLYCFILTLVFHVCVVFSQFISSQARCFLFASPTFFFSFFYIHLCFQKLNKLMLLD